MTNEKADKPVTLNHLITENIMCLRFVEITCDGKPLVVIGGDNAQGKTAQMVAIEMLLNGGRAIPEQPVRRGREKGSIRGVLSNGMVVERSITAKGGGSLKITAPDGETIDRPQTLLDRMKGDLTFDPLAFANAKTQEQRAMLMDLLGLDFSEQDAKKSELFAQRANVSNAIKTLEAQVTPMHPDTPEAEIDVAAAVSEMKAIGEAGALKAEKHHLLGNAITDATKAEESVRMAKSKVDVAEAKAAIEKAQRRLEEATDRRAKEIRIAEANFKDYSAIADEATMEYEKTPDPDTARAAELEKQIQTSAETNQHVRENAANTERAATLKERQAAKRDIQRRMDDIDDAKAETLRTASFPIDGLAFDDTAVTLNGLPFDQASSAEQLTVSVAMGMAMNPELKILMIRDGSLLDERSLALVAEMAREAGGQVWMERVSKGDECAIILEAGQVVEAPASDGMS
jgi:hypothetical protein